MKTKIGVAAICFALGYLPTSGFSADAPAAPAAGGSQEDSVALFRASLRIDKRDFINNAMDLGEEEGKKFWSVYHQYEADLMKLNDKRIANIKDYADNYRAITDSKADELVKNAFEYRKARNALLEKYYGKFAKATSKVIAARFLQVEGVLQGAGDVAVGTSIPLMPKE